MLNNGKKPLARDSDGLFDIEDSGNGQTELDFNTSSTDWRKDI